MKILIAVRTLALLLLPGAALAAEAEAAKELTEFREAAHRILRVAPVPGDDKAMAAKIIELRTRLTPPPPVDEKPMSEQSRPLLTLQNVVLTAPNAASACAMVVRMSAVNPERIASYGVTFAKSGGTWKLTAIETGCGGNGGMGTGEQLFGPVSIL